MLKGKRSVSACTLSSCRIRAEALARAFNNRIWPCAWVSQRSSTEGGDGMSNGIDDEEEFFDASPSPVEVEDESLFCQQHSSAATEAGRAKLYELLQQHAADDAIDVFYDVSEDAGLTDVANGTCLKDEERESDQAVEVCKSPTCCRFSNVENNLLERDLNNETESVFTFPSVNQSGINSETPDCLELQFSTDEAKLATDDPSICCNSDCNSYEEEKVDEDTPENSLNADSSQPNGNVCEAEENESLSEENHDAGDSLAAENDTPKEILENVDTNEKERPHSPSENAVAIVNTFFSKLMKKNSSDISDSIKAEETADHAAEETVDDNCVAIEVTTNLDSPPGVSETAETKVTSPTSRLQVFDESRPKISRSTSLKTGKTPPGTPSRKKIVRFADVLGLDLEDVRHIMTGDVPIIPSSAYTDLNLKGIDFPACEPISETVEISRRDSSGWNPLLGATATNILYPTFLSPGEQPDFMDRVRRQGICLQSVIATEMSVQCTCTVINYGYHKKVTARYTVNEWQTSNDIDASYVSSSSNNETDNFAFSIFLSPQNKSVKFALKYEVNGKEYWDNNRNQNYCLKYHGNYQMQHLPSPLWQHQFW